MTDKQKEALKKAQYAARQKALKAKEPEPVVQAKPEDKLDKVCELLEQIKGLLEAKFNTKNLELSKFV